uniref:guanine nucleotide-binding protein subunit gamma 2-like n=1 Tax=Erigeron canadensis TaxID=72917 RepID=UPI001CB8F6DF|nr:guanine nucleotide-binding protein subunit gamma 2-like [Erigeron canadensis]
MDSSSEPNGDQHLQHKSTTSSSSSRSQNNNMNRTSSSSSGMGSSSNFIGKHRLAAIISLQNQQIQIIQEELDQLETLGESSLVCQELISSVESSTDALLPVTKGPADAGWDRWFQRANQSSRNRKRWI